MAVAVNTKRKANAENTNLVVVWITTVGNTSIIMINNNN